MRWGARKNIINNTITNLICSNPCKNIIDNKKKEDDFKFVKGIEKKRAKICFLIFGFDMKNQRKLKLFKYLYIFILIFLTIKRIFATPP